MGWGNEYIDSDWFWGGEIMAQAYKKNEAVYILHAKPDELAATWEYCQRFFTGTDRYRYQQFSPQEVWAHLQSGGASLFLAVDGKEILGACVACVEATRTGDKSLFIPILGGIDFARWGANIADFIEELAKEHGCKTIEYIGRKGFSRLDDSYIEDGRIYVKEIA